MGRKKTALSERRARRRRLKAAIIDVMKKGCNGSSAAKRYGVREGTFRQWQYNDKAFNVRLKSARLEGIRHVKKVVLAKLRAFKTLKDTAKAVSLHPSTLHCWRKKNKVFNAAVTAALKKARKRRKQRQ
jgi:hypothetical protein